MPVLAQPGDHLRQRQLQLGLQGVRRVDDEHAAGRQAGADHFAGHVGGQLAGFDGQAGVEPAAAGFHGQRFEFARQVMRFGPRNDRVPDHVSAGGKTLDGVGHAGADAGVVAFDLVAGVAKHHGAARRRRQKGLKRFKTVFTRHGHLPAHAQLLDVACERFEIGRVQLKQLELVAPAQKPLLNEGRARVNPQVGGLAALGKLRVQRLEQVHIVLQGGRQRLVDHRLGLSAGFGRLGDRFGQQLENAFQRLAAGLGVVAVQAVETGPGVGVDHGQGRVFLGQVLHEGDQRGVFEHISVVAGMKGVAVAKHTRMLTAAGLQTSWKAGFCR